MRIRKVTFTRLHFALTRRYGDANGLKQHRGSILVKIETDDHLVGWGELLDNRNTLNPKHLQEAADALSGQDPVQAGPIVHRLAAYGPRLAAAVDIALWDIRGKIAGLSIAELLGGSFRKAQPCYASLQNASDDADHVRASVREAERALELGFRHLKMKIGWYGPDKDIAWINAVLDVLPDGVSLAIDANRVLDLASAARVADSIAAPERISWFEEPCSNRVPERYRELRTRIGVPVAGGESMPRATLEKVIAGRMMDIVNPDLVWHGGFHEMQQLFALCDSHGVRLVPHIFDGQLVRVATLHLLAARPDWDERHGAYRASPVEYDISENPLRDDLLETPLRLISTGNLPVPTGPGLGVTVNEELVDRFGTPLAG